MIKKMDHINIVVSNLKKAKDFFVLLGFRADPEKELSGKWISEVVGLEEVEAEYIALTHPGSTVTIELIHYTSPQPKYSPKEKRPNTIGLRHLAFAVDNIESTVTKLQAAGIQFMSEVKTYPATGKKIVYFTGPDDIILELAEYSKI
jgi:catechol 2,3-dioxygenase-like lactoylglutathione lyase family enzyme